MKKIAFLSMLILGGCCQHVKHQHVMKNVSIDQKGNIHTYDDKGNIVSEGFMSH